MKKQFLFLGGLLLGALTSQAQATHCGLAISKSGSGLTRTYTLSVPPTVPSYSFNVYPTTGVTTAGTGLTKTASFTYGGVYSLYLDAPNYCTDSTWMQDTVTGPINCAGIYSYITQTGTGLTRNLTHSTYGTSYAPGYTKSTSYSYGDGTTGTAASHTYASSGSYLVTATTTFSHPSYPSCVKTDTVTVQISNGNPAFNCANAHANFTYTNSGATYTFNNTTTYPATTGVQVSYQWSGAFYASGPGSKTHTFTQNGTYTVYLTAIWSGSGGILCRDSIMKTITVTAVTPPPPAPNVITASANWDSTINAAGASVKMWLIKYDSTTQTLSAVDSALIPVQANVPYVAHDFTGKPAGQYRVKAHMSNQPSSWTTGFLPTYSYNAAYWANASVINHSGATVYANTWLQQGTPMTGPGFISGSVLQGANRGTAIGDPMGNITILLRNNATNQVVASTETDATGTYTFGNVPLGTYNVYPEEMNYATTPSAPIQITATGFPSTANDFWRQTVAKTLQPINPAGVKAVAEEQILISPNPAKDNLTLQFATAPQKGSTVQLYNLSGQLVKSFEVSNTQTSQQLSLNSLAAGNYFLHLPTATGKQISQITIQP